MEKTKQYDVVIIGGGHNGLTTAAYLAKAGAKVLVIERRHETGGGLVTEEFSGFRFNLHAIYMMMLDVAPPYVDLGLEEDGCVYIRPEVEATLLKKNGEALTLYSDLEKSVSSIKKFSAKDAERFREIYLEYKQMSDECLIPSTYAKPVAPADLADMYMKSELGKKILHVSELTPLEICESWGFETAELSALLLYLICMWGIDPEETNSSYLVPLYFNRMLNATLIRGGSHRLSSTLQKAGILAGMDVMESHEVKQIIVENGVATAVEAVPTGTEGPVERIAAKAIITSTDPVTTFGKFIPAAVMQDRSKLCLASVKNWQWEPVSFFGCHLALKKKPHFKAEDYDPAVKTAFIKVFGLETPEDVVSHLREVIQDGKLHEAGHVTFTTDIDPNQAPKTIEPEGAVCRIEACVPYAPSEGRWSEISKQYGDRLLAKLAEYMTDFDSADIIRRYDYTPEYIERKIPQMQEGSFKHGAYVMTQMGYSRPNIQCSSYKTPIGNLYVCGASTFPGGMVIFGSGYNAARVVAENMGLNIWWKEPASITAARGKHFIL